MGVPEIYTDEFKQIGIDGDDFLTLMETACFALHNKRIRETLGSHLDLNDEYLDGLAAKIRAFMNPEGDGDE